MFSTLSVHYQSITIYRFGRPATDGYLLYETCVIWTFLIFEKLYYWILLFHILMILELFDFLIILLLDFTIVHFLLWALTLFEIFFRMLRKLLCFWQRMLASPKKIWKSCRYILYSYGNQTRCFNHQRRSGSPAGTVFNLMETKPDALITKGDLATLKVQFVNYLVTPVLNADPTITPLKFSENAKEENAFDEYPLYRANYSYVCIQIQYLISLFSG